MKIAIEITAEDVTWLDNYLSRARITAFLLHGELAHGTRILARVFDAYVAKCARQGADDGCGMGGAVMDEEGRKDEVD